MRRTLSIFTVIIVLMAMVATAASASWLSDLLWGRHYEKVTPGITYGIDEYLPKEWERNSDLMFRYHKETDKVFSGTVLKIGVMITNKTEDNSEFAICVTDEDMVVGDYSGSLHPKLKDPKDRIGGMRILGTFRGKYGTVDLKTDNMEPGTQYLYAFVKKRGRYQEFNEKPVPLYIAPPLPEMIEALKDASDETLKSWGLEALQTADKVVGEADVETPCKYDIQFSDGMKMRGVQIDGRAKSTRVLGVWFQETDAMTLEGIIRVDEIRGNTIYTSTRSDFIARFAGREECLVVDWVAKVRKYADSSPRRQLTAEQQCNLETYPEVVRGMVWQMATTSTGPITKADGTVVLPDSVTHLKEPYHKNTSGMIQLAYQVWTSQHEHWVPAPREAWMPERLVKCLRVIKLAGSGVTSCVVDEARVRAVDTQGLFPGIAYMIGQSLHRPDKLSVKANACAPTRIDIENNNALSSTNVNTMDTVVNTGEDGSAIGSAGGNGSSGAYSGND